MLSEGYKVTDIGTQRSLRSSLLLLADTDVLARGYVLLGHFRLPTPLSTFSNFGALDCDFIAGRRALALSINSTWKKPRLWATGDELLWCLAVKQQLFV